MRRWTSRSSRSGSAALGTPRMLPTQTLLSSLPLPSITLISSVPRYPTSRGRRPGSSSRGHRPSWRGSRSRRPRSCWSGAPKSERWSNARALSSASSTASSRSGGNCCGSTPPKAPSTRSSCRCMEPIRRQMPPKRSPGRLELVRRSPAIVLDAAHNPHGAQAAAAGITEAFAFAPLVGVVGVMADKDARGLLQIFEEIMNKVVITQVASTSRGMPAEQLGEVAEEIFGADRVRVVPRLDDAIDAAVSLAEESGVGLPGVLITGSVVLVGEARTLLAAGSDQGEGDLDDDWDPEDADAGEDGAFGRADWP